MRTNTTDHCAKWTPRILTELRRVCDLYNVQGPVLDPFAGTGAEELHAALGRDVVGIELEAEWADSPYTLHGNATRLGEALGHEYAGTFGACVTSPPYANRMADRLIRSYEESATYVNALQRQMSEGSLASLQWVGPQGDAYRDLMGKALHGMRQAVRRTHGFILLNVKDHVRQGEPAGVVEWYRQQFATYPFESSDTGLLEVIDVPVRGYRYGANAGARVRAEAVFVWHSHAQV